MRNTLIFIDSYSCIKIHNRYINHICTAECFILHVWSPQTVFHSAKAISHNHIDYISERITKISSQLTGGRHTIAPPKTHRSRNHSWVAMGPAEGRGVSARLSCNHHQSHYSLLDPSWCVRALLRPYAVRGSSFGAFMGMGPVSQHISLNGTRRTPDYSSNPVWREADFHFVEKKR